MNILPPALQALASRHQWINYKLVPRDDGRVDKIPLDPRTGSTCDAHDPKVWMTAKEAMATGLPLGFVFTDTDPNFFIDIDHCKLPDGTWSSVARDLCSRFAGCAIEVSQSNEGLHIFGTQPPGDWPHCSDNKTIGTQFYTTKRFVALTGLGIEGNAGIVPTPEIYAQFISEYFPAGPMATPGDISKDWTLVPTEDWDGPENDDELIAKMLRSKSARGILGNTATLKQLWDADEGALGKTYPDTMGTQGRPFDRSLADAALCSHLAFWTGKNCKRMDTLFRQSALMRDKWDARGNYYSQRTILNAISMCSKVYQQRRKPDSAVSPTDPDKPGFQYFTLQSQKELFAGCCYVRDIHRVFVPDTGALLKPEQFRAVFGGYVFTIDALGNSTTRNAWEVFTESQAIRFPRVHSTCFRPELAPGEIIHWEGSRYVNTYVPIITECVKGDPTPFLNLLSKILPVSHDRSILLSYMAACVQYPGVKFQWSPLLQGVQGNGKSFIGTCLVHAIGERYTHVLDSKDISNIFNAWLRGKLLILIEEVYTKERIDTIEALKWMIANRRVPMQAKGQDQITGDNRANFFMCSNHKDAVHKTRADRRFCVFYTAQQVFEDLAASGMEGDYFPKLYEWARTGGFAIVNQYLQSYTIPDEMNPATSCHRAPVTSSTNDVIVGSRSVVEQDVIEAIESGRPGFIGGWVSSIAFNTLLKEVHLKIPTNKQKDILREIGYAPHPALTRGRANNIVPVEGGKPVLYVQKGHPVAAITDAAMACRIYQEAQGYILGAGATGQTNQTMNGL